MSMPAQVQVEDKPTQSFDHYLGIAWRHRRRIVGAACAVWGLALIASFVIPAKYRSQAVILIEQPRVSAQYVTPNASVDLQDQVEGLTQQILSRPRLIRIMDAFHLYGKSPNEVASDGMVQQMRSNITIDLIKPPGRSDELSAFQVSFAGPDPQLTQQVTSQLAALFIDENLRHQEQVAEDTTTFLDSQLNDARADLEHQEKLLQQFRSKYMGELPEQLQSNVQILAGLQGRLQSAMDALNQAEQQRLYLTSLLGQYSTASKSAGALPDNSATAVGSSLDDQIETMKASLAELNTRYTPMHPDVVRLKRQIAAAERQRQRAAETAAKAGTAGKNDALGGESRRPVITPTSQMESQLKANEFAMENDKREIKDLEGQIGQYQARLNLTPTREQEFADVSRNHEQSQQHYESLLAKKLQSEMATALEKQQQGVQFRIIDPPSLPQRPYWPNRLIFGLGGLLAGAILAFCACLLQETAEARIHREDELAELVPAPVMVTIPPMPTAAEMRRKQRLARLEIAAGVALLVLLPLTTLAAYWKS